jgi:lysophospholipase L1-like esterase
MDLKPLCIVWALFAGAGALAQERTIALMGASTSAGVGATTYDSSFAGRYAHYLQGRNPAWSLVNLGVSGYTTYQEMPTGSSPPSGRPQPDPAHNISKVISLHPRVLLICMGTNDIADGYPATEYEANYDTLRALAERAGITVWITTPLPRSAVDAPKRAMLLALRDRILSRYAPRALDFYDSLGDGQGNYYPAFNSGDGIHTNNHGHRLLCERVVAADLIGAAATSIRDRRGAVTAASLGKAGSLPERIWKGQDQIMLLGPGMDIPRDIRGRSSDLIFR